MPIRIKRSYAALAGGIIATGGLAYYTILYSPISNAQARAPLSSNGNIIALVNDRPVYEFEIVPLMQNGVDRSIALDRRITQSVIATAAEKQYAKEAQAALDAARSDILAQIYARKKTEAVRAAVTDKDITAFYEKNVTDEDSRKFKLRSYMTADAREAQTMYEALVKDPYSKEVLPKLQYMKPGEDHFAGVQEVPYGLGQTIKKMKAGETMQPVVTREGVLVLYIEQVKDLPKPTLEKVKEEIRNYLVNERLGEEIQTLRKAARIELKG